MNQTSNNITYEDTHEWMQEEKLFDLPAAWIIILTTIMAIALISTIIGNTMVIIVFVTSDILKSSVNNHFLVSLAVADLLVGLLVMPCAVDALRVQTWRCGPFKYFNAFGNFCFCISSIMHLMVLSVDKYFSIARPLKYPHIVTQGRAYIACIVLWLYSGFWALLPLLGVSSYECFIPYIGFCASKDWSMNGLNFAFAISVVSGTYGVALIVMFVVYLKIAKIIQRQTRRIAIVVTDSKDATQNTQTNKPSLIKRYRGVVTLITLIITYLVCWSPFCVMLFIEIGRAKKIEGVAPMIGMLVGFINSCCNPIIYWAQYKRFRRAILRLLRKGLLFLPVSMDSNNVHSLSQTQGENTFQSIQVNRLMGQSTVKDVKKNTVDVIYE